MPLQTPIANIPKLQPQIAKRFHQLGVVTLRDALFYFPFRHEDWRARADIADVTPGQDITLQASVVSVSSRRAWHRRGLTITDALVVDERGGRIHAVWYNLPFLAKSLQAGDQLFLSGTITTSKQGRLEMRNPVYERPSDEPLHERLVPVYRSTEGLSQRQIRLLMKRAVEFAAAIPDPLSSETRLKYDLDELSVALANIHFPATPQDAARAVRRLKFDELLVWRLRTLQADLSNRQLSPSIPFHESEVRSFVQHLPFTLTNDQRVTAWQVLQDIHATQPMSRLIQGDVGSGKTVIAALVAYNAALSHHQVALAAPTVVLAQQHWSTFISMLGKHDIALAFLSGSSAKIFRAGTEVEVRRAELLSAIQEGTVPIVVGTHALFSPDVHFHQLGLVIVDEQQRFGVDQRQALLGQEDVCPHFLSLTATPIPRSFALWLSGILAVSTITQKPPKRLPIQTTVIDSANRELVNTAMQETLARHEQIYVITPLIEESDTLGVKAAVSEHRRLHELLPHNRVGLLHGAMSDEERTVVLDNFRQHNIDVLVSTTVIEVGVDVPNATLMIIEGAERFGLSQLHQLRGRIGRSEKQSTCLLCSETKNDATRERLKKVATLQDGFAIAELDFQERGGGDMYGQRQSGLPTWQLANLRDHEIFQSVCQYSDSLTPQDRAYILSLHPEDEHKTSTFHPE